MYTYVCIICLKSTSLNFINSCSSYPSGVHNCSLPSTYCFNFSLFLSTFLIIMKTQPHISLPFISSCKQIKAINNAARTYSSTVQKYKLFQCDSAIPSSGRRAELNYFHVEVNTGAAKSNTAAGVVDRKSILGNRKQQECAVQHTTIRSFRAPYKTG